MIFADEYYMGLALSEARAAAAEDEIPIGAIVVGPDGRILGRGHNQTERLRDVTAHAEMLAISAAAQTLGGKYLTGCTLYVTVAPDPKRGYSRILRPGTTPFHPRAEVTEGVLEGPCRAIMQDFFINKRNKK